MHGDARVHTPRGHLEAPLGSAPSPRAPAARSDATEGERESDRRSTLQFELLQEWRDKLERAGFSTLICLAAPIGLLVASPIMARRWVLMRPSGLLIVLRELEDGSTTSDFRLLERTQDDVAGPSAEVALAAASRHLAPG